MATQRTPPRQRRARPEPEAPSWVTQLRAALFTPEFPQVDPHYQAMDGTPFRCERTVAEEGQRLLYREMWRDPQTGALVHTWWQELDVSSFVGTSPYVLARNLATLRQLLAEARPVWPRQRVPRAWALPHERLGRRIPGGWR